MPPQFGALLILAGSAGTRWRALPGMRMVGLQKYSFDEDTTTFSVDGCMSRCFFDMRAFCRGFTYDRLNRHCYFSLLQCADAGALCVEDPSGQFDHFDHVVRWGGDGGQFDHDDDLVNGQGHR